MLWLGPTSNQPTFGPRRKSIHIMDARPSTVRRVSGVLLEVIDDVARGHLHRVQGAPVRIGPPRPKPLNQPIWWPKITLYGSFFFRRFP